MYEECHSDHEIQKTEVLQSIGGEFEGIVYSLLGIIAQPIDNHILFLLDDMF
jgi:hypothetical protein